MFKTPSSIFLFILLSGCDQVIERLKPRNVLERTENRVSHTDSKAKALEEPPREIKQESNLKSETSIYLQRNSSREESQNPTASQDPKAKSNRVISTAGEHQEVNEKQRELNITQDVNRRSSKEIKQGNVSLDY